MNINKNTKGLSEAAILAAIICILGIMGLYIPFLSFVLILIPTPLMILGKRYNIKYSVMALIVSSVIITMVSNPLTGVVSVLVPGIAGVTMGEFLKRKYRPSLTLGIGTLISIVSTIIALLLILQISGISVVEQIETVLNESFAVQEKIYSLSGADEQTIATAKQMLQDLKNMVIMTIPAMVILMGFITAYVNMFFTILILRRTNQKTEGFMPFRYFRLSKSASQGIAVIILLTILIGYLNIVDNQVLTFNIYILGVLIFGLQGMAVIAYFLRYYGVMNILKIFVFLVLFFTSMGEIMLVFIGIADIFLDFRKYRKEKESNS